MQTPTGVGSTPLVGAAAAGADKEQQEATRRITPALEALLEKGRSAGKLTIGATHKPTSHSLPTSLRGVSDVRFATSKAVRAVIGETQDPRLSPTSLDKEAPGFAIVDDGADFQRARFYRMPKVLTAGYPARSPSCVIKQAVCDFSRDGTDHERCDVDNHLTFESSPVEDLRQFRMALAMPFQPRVVLTVPGAQAGQCYLSVNSKSHMESAGRPRGMSALRQILGGLDNPGNHDDLRAKSTEVLRDRPHVGKCNLVAKWVLGRCWP